MISMFDRMCLLSSLNNTSVAVYRGYGVTWEYSLEFLVDLSLLDVIIEVFVVVL